MELGAEMTAAVPRVGKWRWTGCSFTFTINTHLFTLPQHQHHRGKKLWKPSTLPSNGIQGKQLIIASE